MGLSVALGSAGLAGCSPAQGTGQSKSSEAASPLLAIIHTNDTHGHDVAVEGTEDVQGNFSMAAVSALKAEWEQKGYDVVLVDAGDATQGMPLVDTAKGAPAIAFMNACGYAMMTVGNHDFDWGADALAANEKAANFPFLSANVLNKQTGELRFTPNKVVELSDGTKVGFFGLTTPSTFTETNPKNVDDLDFLSGEQLYACAQEQVNGLRLQGCDMVVCVGHMGNKNTGATTSKDVLNHVKGIDLFIDGHDHDEVQDEVDGTLLVETGCYLHNIGVVAIDKGVPASQAIGKPKGIGAFPQVSGITYTVDASVPYQEGPTYPDSTYASPAAPGTRVTIADVAGRGFDADATYSIATTSFICTGGDTYYVFKVAADAERPTAFGFDYEAFISYLTVECNHTVPDAYAQPQGRITITGA